MPFKGAVLNLTSKWWFEQVSEKDDRANKRQATLRETMKIIRNDIFTRKEDSFMNDLLRYFNNHIYF